MIMILLVSNDKMSTKGKLLKRCWSLDKGKFGATLWRFYRDMRKWG